MVGETKGLGCLHLDCVLPIVDEEVVDVKA